jgi:C-terminal processing protease CtpA/Prc
MKHLKTIWGFGFMIIVQLNFAQQLTTQEIHQLTTEIIQTIDEHYIIPDLKNTIVKTITTNLEHGKYDNITSKTEFEKVITNDLKTISDDGHLYLVSNQETTESKKSPKRQMMRSIPDPEAFKDLLTYKMLDGNIAYLEVPMFGPLEYLKEDIDAYLELSKSAEALIIDVRNCPGGSGVTTSYLAGGFIGAPKLLTTYHSKDGASQSYSTKTKYGTLNNHKKVYVLTSKRTGSAAEGFAFYLQQLGRVQVVGMQSSGAGRSNQFYPIGKEFSLSVSIRTSITPNGKQFQGIGVTPDIITPSKNALQQAKIQAYLDLQLQQPDKVDTYNQLIEKVSTPKIRLQSGDLTKITKTVKGYIENFFENNTDEMYKYLHPDLAKRGFSKKRNKEGIFFQNMTEDELRTMLSRKKALPKSKQQNEVEILDVFYNSANVKLITGYSEKMKWVEYILLCRIDNEWKITDIVWDYFPSTKSKAKKN